MRMTPIYYLKIEDSLTSDVTYVTHGDKLRLIHKEFQRIGPVTRIGTFIDCSNTGITVDIGTDRSLEVFVPYEDIIDIRRV